MADVVILKQPLYGSVEWDGIQFIYTPKPEFTGNDSYTYKITDSTGTKVLTEYVNPTNRPPITKNITLNVNALTIKEISILDLIEDTTNPFDYLIIKSLSADLSRSSVSYNSDKIIFEAGSFDAVETILYTISDKQFDVSGTIIINIINGIPDSYKGSPYARFAVAISKMNLIKPLTANWTSMADFIATYGPIWDTIDAVRYNLMADEVSANSVNPHYAQWDTAYANLSTYISLYNTVTSSSADWELTVSAGTVIYNTLTSEILNYYSSFNTITGNNYKWDNALSGTSALSSFSLINGGNTTSTFNTLTSVSSDWDTAELNTFSAANFNKWDNLYKVLSTDQKYTGWEQNVADFNYLSSVIYNIHDEIDSVYSTLTSASSNWDTTELNAFSAANFPVWNNLYNTLTSKYDTWNVTILSSFTAKYFQNADTFNDLYNNTFSNSATLWDTTELNTFSADNFHTWNSLLSTVNQNSWSWMDAKTTLSGLSTFHYLKLSAYDSLNDTVTSKSVTDWDMTLLEGISSYLPFFDQVFHEIIYKDDNTTLWDNTYNLIQPFSGEYIQNTNNYTSTSSTVVDNVIYWSDVSTSTALTGNSSNWINVYNTLTSLSSKYTFEDRDSTVNLNATITAYSADWNSLTDTVSTKKFGWTNTSEVSSISSQALTGNLNTTVSAKDLAVYGTTLITGNLSALGKRITIDTSVATTSSFIINNEGSTNALVVNKTGGFNNAILNLGIATPSLTSSVLYVKTTNSVNINLSSLDTTNALTVSGNISASGSIYPLNNAVTVFSANSGKYTSTYNTITSISGDFNKVVLLSSNYNSTSNYINLSSTVISELKNNRYALSSYVNVTTNTSAYNNIVNNHVSLCAGEYGKDTTFRNNKARLDNFYNNVTLITGGTKTFNINVLFSYNNNVSAIKSRYIVEDNIRINSWTMAASKDSVVTVDVLSSDYTTYGSGVVVSKANKPHLDNTDPVKITSTGVSSWLRNISKDSILEFNMRNFTPNVNTTYLNYERINPFNATGGYSNIITPNGKMYAWGANPNGNLGTGNFSDKSTPTLLSTAPITAVYTFGDSVFVKGVNNELSSFGLNVSYELGLETGLFLGHNTAIPSATKVNIPYIKKIKSKSSTVMVLGFNNILTGWGSNTGAKLGLDSYAPIRSVPTELRYPPAVDMLITGSNTYAIGVDGGLSGCGAFADGQLGVGAIAVPFGETAIKIPIKINLPPVASIYGDTDNQTTIFALGTNGELSGWGGNVNGNLGNGDNTDRFSPVRINTLPIKQFIFQGRAAYAVGIDDKLSAWGYNYNTGGTQTNTPVLIPTPPISKLYVEGNLRFVIGFDGGLSGWGVNDKRQLANNTNTQYFIPVKIDVPPVSAISIGSNHVLALGTNGELSAWGANNVGQIGTGTTSVTSQPFVPSTPSIVYPVIPINNTEILLSLNVSKL